MIGSLPRRLERLVPVASLLLCALGTGCSPRLVAPEGAGVDVERDVVYLRRGDVELRADVYAPRGSGPFPGVLVVHGGSWQRGSKERMTATAEQLAQRGYVAVNINYRLAPDYRFPAQLYDCQEAVRWMRSNAERLRLDPDHIGGFGYSAGAHLIALLATTDASDGLDEAAGTPAGDTRLQAAVLGAAPIDLQRFRPNRAMDRLLGAAPDERPDVYAYASPIRFVSPDDPPMFLYHGSSDWMVDPSQSQLMVEALQHAGVPSDLYETSGGHFTTFLFDEGQVSHAIDFLDRWLKTGLARRPAADRPA